MIPRFGRDGQSSSPERESGDPLLDPRYAAGAQVRDAVIDRKENFSTSPSPPRSPDSNSTAAVDLRLRIAQAEERAEALEQSNNELRMACDTMHQRAREREREAFAEERRVEELEEEIWELKEKLRKDEDRDAELESAVQELRRERDAAVSDAENLEQARNELERAVKKQQEVFAAAQARLERLDDENAALRSQCAKEQREAEELERKVKEVRLEKETLARLRINYFPGNAER